MDELRSSAISGVKWTAIKSWYSQGMSLVVLLIMARLLEPAEFGLFAIGSVIVMLLTSIANQGLSNSLIQRETIVIEHEYSVFWTTAGIGLLLAAILITAREPVAAFFDAPDLALILPALALVQLLNALTSVAGATLVRRLDFRRTAIATIGASTCGAVTAVGMGYSGFGVWSLVGQHLVSAIAALVLTWLLAAWWPRILFSRSHLLELWQFGALTMVGSLIVQLNRRTDALLIGGFMGSTAVGLFSVGRRVVEMGTESVSATVGQVAMPTFARMQNDEARIKTAYLNGGQTMLCISMPMFALLALYCEQVTHLFLGEKWIQGAPILGFLSLGAAVGSANWLGGSVLMAKGRAGLRLAIPSTSLTTGVILFLFLYPYGITTVAAGFALRAYLMVPFVAFMVGRVLPLTLMDFFRTIMPPLAATAAASTVAFAIGYELNGQIGDLGILILGSSVALVVYWLALNRMAPQVTRRLYGYAKEAIGRH